MSCLATYGDHPVGKAAEPQMIREPEDLLKRFSRELMEKEPGPALSEAVRVFLLSLQH